MGSKRFSLVARVSTDSPEKIRPVLERLYGSAAVRAGNSTDELVLETDVEGADAKELNRALLSELRRAEKRTRLRSEWSSGETTTRFFDYVQKGRTKGKTG